MVSRKRHGEGWWWGARVCVVGVLLCVGQALALPLPLEGPRDEGGGVGGREFLHALLGVAMLLSSVTTLLACVCCKRSRGFKELGSVSSRVEGSNNTLSQGPQQEITLFPPPGSHLSLSSTQINFEPLPDIRPRAGTHPRDPYSGPAPLPASFPSSPLANLPTDQWFAEPHQNFPRGQLQYVKELGNGWFGKVLEGRASGIFSDHTKGESPPVSSTSANPRLISTRVAVRALREDASAGEQAYFLHELRPYRDLTHANVLKVLAYCLETEPFLILLQLCPKGDLKGVVRGDQSFSEAVLLRMVLDAASGLEHMHSQNFIHTDLAARNCLVDEDLTVKIGDYGYNIDSYKNEYYCAGDVALPLRWCAPETLRCTDTTIETKEVTRAANVWSFGVLVWEVVCRGELPYPDLDDDRVIQRVVMEKSCLPDQPLAFQLHRDKLYNIMRQCWSGEDTRPPMIHILSLLTHLWQHSPHHTAPHTTPLHTDPATMDDFEVRWKQLQQQQHCRDHSILHLANTTDLRFESDFSLSGSGQLGAVASPSLQNLHGSAEDLDARMAAKFGSALPSWLGIEPGQPIDSLTQEITDAILKLDNYLAGEKSEPSTAQTSPENGSGINFKVGKDSFVSNPPDSKVPRIPGLSVDEGSGHPSLTVSDGEDEGFTMRLEQGEFTEMVRLKSQSVQDFMKLTVVDDTSDSDNASQRNSLAFEPLTQEKTFASEGNIKEALRDVKFMGELERLQAEHRYSIITEASREYMSSIEYRMQEVNSESVLRRPEVGVESEAGSTDKLATSTESVSSSSNYLEGGHSERDPFLGEVISSEQTGESRPSNDSPGDVNSGSGECKSSSVGQKQPLPATPDCVVSSRKPKPMSLPDIVAHNSNVKFSTPSPSPEDSPARIVNKEQPKEFRFVFEGETDRHGKLGELRGFETSSQCDSVIFSENIKNIEANHVAASESSGKEGKNYQGVNEKISSLVDQGPFDNFRENESHKNGDVNKFCSLIQGESKGILTSTPYKNDDPISMTKAGIGEDSDSSPFICNNLAVSSKSLKDGDKDSVERINSVENEIGTKHRLVFGSRKKKDVDDDDENEDNDEASIIETKDCIDVVPNYKPERIVEGEDIVIGALEDFSLDLYRAVKSTDAPHSCPDEESSLEDPPTAGENVDPSSIGVSKVHLEREISKTETEVSGIEFDLEQWDTFLDSTMSVEKFDSDADFKESLMKIEDVQSDFKEDILTSTIKSPENCLENIAINKHVKLNVSDIDSTFDRSTCDEICNIMASESTVESGTPEGRPEVNVSMFFSSDASLNNKKNVSDVSEVLEHGVKESSGKIDLANNTSGKYSDESFYSAQSASSELFRSAVANLDSKLIPDMPTTVSADNSDVTLGKETPGSLSSSSLMQDTPSNSFTYKREGTVDSNFDSLDHVDYGAVGTLTTSFENFDDVATKKVDVEKCSQSGIHEALNKALLDAVSEKLNKNESDVSVNVTSDFKFSGDLLPSTTYTEGDSNPSKDISKFNNNDTRPVTSPAHGSPVDKSPIQTSPTYPSPFVVSSNKRSPTQASPHSTSPFQFSPNMENREGGTGESEGEVENRDFWQQQMVAWQEAAFQTRQLLQEAADGGGRDSADGGPAMADVLEPSPLSDASSRSRYSSTDLLNLDDEGSYVSYNTTDDEEVFGYKPEDINALRAELNLKLGGVSEEQHLEQQQDLEPEEPDDQVAGERENVVINYRGILATTLSPIKEESFLEDEDSPMRKLSIKSSSDIDSIHDPSIEFEEPEEDNADGQDTEKTFTVTSFTNEQVISTDLLGLSDDDSLGERIKDKSAENNEVSIKYDIADESKMNDTFTIDRENVLELVSIENTHDSLILEDLEDEDGPPSIQIINSRTNLEVEDILVVDTETNQATILDQGRPRSHLAFITDQEEVERTDVELFVFDETDDVAPESIPSVGGSRFDEMRYREQFITNNPSWEKPCSIGQQDFEGDLESKPATDFLISSLPSGSPESTSQHQVPHYHSYFTSALSSIAHPNVTTFSSLTHPNVSLEESREPQHISLPYDVNYPAAGEQLHSLEDINNGGATETRNGEEAKISEIEDDEETPIKLNFLGRFYSDESEDKDEKDDKGNSEKENKEENDEDKNITDVNKGDKGKRKTDKSENRKSSDAREASLLSDSEDDDDTKVLEPTNASQMTSAQFLASKTYQTNDAEEVEEEIEVEAGYDEDSEDEEEEEEEKEEEGGRSPRRSVKEGEDAAGGEKGGSSRDPRYTPDWESDSESDGESSSTSGEFMWREDEDKEKDNGKDGEENEKPGEPCQPATYMLDVIEEEPEGEGSRRDDDEEEEEEEGGGGSGGEESESGEEEFTPSQWNSNLTPSHSLLKSPLNKNLKKRVQWKRQRHHRVYEYPPEPRSWEPVSSLGGHSDHSSHQRRAWQRSSLDYLTLADWELGSDEFIADDGGDLEDYVYHKPTRPAPPPPIYSLGSVTYDDASEGFLVDNGEFFIRSSGSPFTFNRSTFSASDFFSGGHPVDYDVLFGTTQSQASSRQVEGNGISNNVEQVEPVEEQGASVSDQPAESENIREYEHDDRDGDYVDDGKTENDLPPAVSINETDTNFPTLDDLDQASSASASLGQLRHTRDRLRLEIPSISVGGDDLAGLENGRAFPSASLKRTEPEVSEV